MEAVEDEAVLVEAVAAAEDEAVLAEAVAAAVAVAEVAISSQY